MNRRDFIALSGAAALTPPMAQAARRQTLAYSPGLVEQLSASGKTVFIDFYTEWCGTCRTQVRVITGLRIKNKAYDANMIFVKVNWDIYSGSPVSRKYNIPRRSTLLVLKGDQELGRIVAGTGLTSIKALMDLGLAAA